MDIISYVRWGARHLSWILYHRFGWWATSNGHNIIGLGGKGLLLWI